MRYFATRDWKSRKNVLSLSSFLAKICKIYTTDINLCKNAKSAQKTSKKMTKINGIFPNLKSANSDYESLRYQNPKIDNLRLGSMFLCHR